VDRSVGSSTQEIAALEQMLYRAMIGRDLGTLGGLLSDELQYVHSTGVVESKAEYLAAVANGVYEYERIASRGVRILVHAETAVATGEVEMSVSAAGEPKRLIRLLFTLVWVREPGQWRLLVRQATRILPG
jgi:uncharacterized protein DUF4440